MNFYDVLAAKKWGGGSPAPEPVLIAKTITANGTVSLAFADGSDEKEELWCLAVKEREITLGYLNGTMIIFR